MFGRVRGEVYFASIFKKIFTFQTYWKEESIIDTGTGTYRGAKYVRARHDHGIN